MRIVITGAGIVTPLGQSCCQTWRAVLQGRCGMGPMPAMETPLPQNAQGGQAIDLPENFAPHLPRESRYLRFAIRDALAEAGAKDALPYPPQRCGIVVGTTLHGMRSGGRFLRSGDAASLKDFMAGNVLRNAAGDLRFEGGAISTCSACSSGLGSIAAGVSLLRSGQLDLVVAGGYDTISEYVYGGFNSLRLVAPAALRPFSRQRQGMKLSEGYGIVVLERVADAHQRGARPLATILGFGESSDAHHLTQPHPEGEGAARAIEAALHEASLSACDIGLIAAHATGTPDNDAAEFEALRRVFGTALPRTPVVAFKSHLGHTLGGAGAVELVLSMMALREQVVPACPNACSDEVEFPGLNLAVDMPRPARIATTLNVSLGFGGANACMILGPPPRLADALPPLSRGRQRTPEVFISGIGVVLPGAVGNEAFRKRFSDGKALAPHSERVADDEIASLLNARRVRRMSDYVKLSLAAAALCLQDADITDTAAFCENCAAVLGTAHGSANYCEAYYRQIVNEGIVAANPMLFAEGVPNAAAAHLSLMLSLKGPCQTVIGSRTAALDALRMAFTRIAAGEWARGIVGAAEEFSPPVNAAYQHWGLCGPGGFSPSSGAIMLLLESAASLASRGGRPRGAILAAAGGMAGTPAAMPRLYRHILNQLGQPQLVVGSANGTWIDRVEAAGRAAGTSLSPYRYVGECFSVLPLAGLAAVLLGQPPLRISSSGPITVMAADYAGAVSGVSFKPA